MTKNDAPMQTGVIKLKKTDDPHGSGKKKLKIQDRPNKAGLKKLKIASDPMEGDGTNPEPQNVGSLRGLLKSKDKAGTPRGWARVKATHKKQK
jgi:hypothetical protein